jgi:hypothetical protein
MFISKVVSSSRCYDCCLQEATAEDDYDDDGDVADEEFVENVKEERD